MDHAGGTPDMTKGDAGTIRPVEIIRIGFLVPFLHQRHQSLRVLRPGGTFSQKQWTPLAPAQNLRLNH